jgi:hypothetical protein
MLVADLEKNMPADEYTGWIMFFNKRAEEQNREAQGKPGNLLAGSKANLIQGLTGAGLHKKP